MSLHICNIMSYSYIGAIIKKHRNSKGLTQEQLARLAEITVGHLIRLENNRSANPTIGTLDKLSKALGISVHDMIRGGARKRSKHDS